MQKNKKELDTSDKKVKRLYHQRYRTEWEKFPAFANWLRSSNDGYTAHCRICDINVLARLASIKQHLITRKHQEGARCNDFLSQNMIKGETDAVNQMIKPHAAKIKGDPDAPPQRRRAKAKPKPKANLKAKRPPAKVVKRELKIERSEEEVEEHDIASNDSILDDLLGNEPMAQEQVQEYVVEGEAELIDENLLEEEVSAEDPYEELMPELNDDAVSEDVVIISEFDLFGKSLALQLNNMDLEDALLCQERLQVVLTEFRLKILKRKREGGVRSS